MSRESSFPDPFTSGGPFCREDFRTTNTPPMRNPENIRGLLTWNRAEAERYFERSKAEQYIRPWREVAGELAESGSALVNELREGRRPCPLVLSLFLEACTSYDRMTEEKAEGESLKAEELEVAEISGAAPVNSRLYKKLTLFHDLLTPISSEMEALYYRDTTAEERSFPDDLIHWGDPDIVEDLKRLNLI